MLMCDMKVIGYSLAFPATVAFASLLRPYCVASLMPVNCVGLISPLQNFSFRFVSFPIFSQACAFHFYVDWK
jgi:hypothetical protein